MTAGRATLAVAPSRVLVDELTEVGWLRGLDPRIVPHSIDVARWSTVAPVAQSGPVILQVGTIGFRKGSDWLIRAVAKLLPDVEGLRAVLVGNCDRSPDGRPMDGVIADLAAELGVPCEIVGWVSRSELEHWYGIARVIAVPSRYESFSLAALEGMAAGRPVVCSSRTGLSDLADETEGALTVVPVDDVDALAASLRPYLLDPDAADTGGRRARAFVERRLSPEHIAGEREAVYEEAIRLWRAKQQGRPTRSAGRRRDVGPKGY